MDATSLDEPAIVAVRRIALDLANDASARWHDLASSSPAERAGGDAAEALHDYRVALRTLRSWLRAHADVLAVPGKVRTRLRRAAAATNGARDAEVLAALLAKVAAPSMRSAAAARWWSDRLVADANDIDVIERSGKSVQRGLAGVIKAVSVVHVEQPLDAPWHFPSLAADLATRVRAQADELRERLGAIDASEAVEAQHKARIAAKNLRYLLEPVSKQLAEAKPARKHLKALQDSLGDLRDLRVARAALIDAVEARERYEALHRSDESDSLLSGFTTLDAMLHEAGDDGYRAVHDQWLADGAAALFEAVDAAIAALAERGRAGVEIERKLLLGAAPDVPAAAVTSVVEIDQGYLPGSRIGERVRRITDGDGVRYVRTVKMGRGIARIEVEEEIDVALFAQLWALTDGRRLRKQRTRAVDEQSRTWEIDVFLDRDLVVVEIELDRVDDDATPPPWIAAQVVRDVTDEPAYSNAQLAR